MKQVSMLCETVVEHGSWPEDLLNCLIMPSENRFMIY